jgi:hypothetical protein
VTLWRLAPLTAHRRAAGRIIIVAVLGGMIVASPSALLAGPSSSGLVGTPSSQVSCRVLGPNGNPVTEVAAASFGDLSYWLEFRSSGELATTVQFRTAPLFEGSPALGQVQKFDTDDSNVVTTPFGVPDWGLDKTSGPWALKIRDNLGRSATCEFEVVP